MSKLHFGLLAIIVSGCSIDDGAPPEAEVDGQTHDEFAGFAITTVSDPALNGTVESSPVSLNSTWQGFLGGVYGNLKATTGGGALAQLDARITPSAYVLYAEALKGTPDGQLGADAFAIAPGGTTAFTACSHQSSSGSTACSLQVPSMNSSHFMCVLTKVINSTGYSWQHSTDDCHMHSTNRYTQNIFCSGFSEVEAVCVPTTSTVAAGFQAAGQGDLSIGVSTTGLTICGLSGLQGQFSTNGLPGNNSNGVNLLTVGTVWHMNTNASAGGYWVCGN